MQEYNIKKYKNNPFFERLKKFDDKGWLSLAVLDRTVDKPVFKSNMVNESRDNFAHNHTLQKQGFCNYIGLNVFSDNRRIKDLVSNFNGFFFDFDDGDQGKIDRIINDLGEPTWKINTTKSLNKWQLIYLFDTPVSKDEAENWVEKSRALTEKYEADHCFDISRVFRLPNSVNGKNGELVTVEDTGIEYSYLNDFNLK